MVAGSAFIVLASVILTLPSQCVKELTLLSPSLLRAMRLPLVSAKCCSSSASRHACCNCKHQTIMKCSRAEENMRTYSMTQKDGVIVLLLDMNQRLHDSKASRASSCLQLSKFGSIPLGTLTVAATQRAVSFRRPIEIVQLRSCISSVYIPAVPLVQQQ